MGSAIGDDARGQGRPDARKEFEILLRGRVRIDAPLELALCHIDRRLGRQSGQRIDLQVIARQPLRPDVFGGPHYAAHENEREQYQQRPALGRCKCEVVQPRLSPVVERPGTRRGNLRRECSRSTRE